MIRLIILIILMSTNIPALFQPHLEALRQVKAPFFYGRFGGAAALAA
jgi:hypothetical protein